MTLTESLLQRILAYCAEENVTERQFGLTVANNHKLISRLRAGFGVNSQTHDRIIAFIEAGKEPRAAKASAQAANDARKSKAKRPRSAGATANTSNSPTSSAKAA